MPPRYAYWTILVDEQPTAFRAASQEDLMPTFKRLKAKNASAKMMWWQNGKLWESRLDAQEAMRARGEMGRRGDARQRQDDWPAGRLEWRPKDQGFRAPRGEARQSRDREGGLEWKPKGEGRPQRERTEWKPKGEGRPQRERTDWKPKGEGRPQRERPEWKPRDEGRPQRERKEWKPKAGKFGAARPEWKPKGNGRPQSNRRDGGSNRSFADRRPPGSDAGKLEWKPKGDAAPPKRKWVPKEEYKKSHGVEAKRDKNWRPGGTHQDPRQKYKDAKKAKWGRFKQNIRQKWEAKQGRKKRDEE